MTIRHSRQKLAAASQLLEEFEAAKFPHSDSAAAIKQLHEILKVTGKQFKYASSAVLTVQTEMEASDLISGVLVLLGVISNSANVRNSFEIHGPFLSLARRILDDPSAKLIISFEWDYIPYTYPQNHPLLPSFVIIGLPASEASNALVLPAIGHELGHSLWRRVKGTDDFEPRITKALTDAIRGPLRTEYQRHFRIDPDLCYDLDNLWTWEEASDYCFRQVEELFSDFTGLLIFGSSYLDAFEYLLSPSLSPERHPDYPPVAVRAEYLRTYASVVGASAPSAFESLFFKEASPFNPRTKSSFQVTLADTATKQLVSEVATYVAALGNKRGIRPPDQGETLTIMKDFSTGVPAQNTTGVGAILNAGWAAFKDSRFMGSSPDSDRMNTINELVLKSVEVFEIERMTRRGAKTKRAKARP